MNTKYDVVQYYVVFTDCFGEQRYKIFFNEESAFDFLDFISEKPDVVSLKLLRLEKLSSVSGI